MKKTVLFLFFLTLPFFVFLSKARAYSLCYTNSGATEVQIGDMLVFGEMPAVGNVFFTSFTYTGGRAWAEFADKGSDAIAGSVYFKIGTEDWVSPSSVQTITNWETGSSYKAYFLNFTPKDTKSNLVINTRWNSAKDAGAAHYCCDSINNYKAGVDIYPNLLPNYTWSYTNPYFANGKVALYDYYTNYIMFDDIRCGGGYCSYCGDYSLYLNGQIASMLSSSGDVCSSPNLIFSTNSISSNGKVTVSFSPTENIASGTFSNTSGYPEAPFLHGLMFEPQPTGWEGGCLYSGWSPPEPPPSLTTCPGTISQEDGTCKYTLINEYEPSGSSDYTSYVEFTADVPNEYPYVAASTLEVRAGKWGGGTDYRIVCKVRDMTTGQETSEVQSNVFPQSRRCSDSNFGTLPSDWMTLDFSSDPVELIDGRTYRLYCRSNYSWAPLCWTYSCGDPEYGKDYKINVDVCPNAECSSATLSPSSFSLAPEEQTGVVVSSLTGSALLDVHVDHVVFSTSDNGVASVSNPVSDTSYPFQNTITGEAQGGATIRARVFLNPDDGNYDCEGTSSVTVDQVQSAWFQTKEADVHAGGDIRSEIISGDYFSQVGDGGTHGLVSYGGSNTGFGDGSVSSEGWLANTSLSTKSYSYFYSLLGSPDTDNFNSFSDITADGTYYSEDSVTISGNIDASRKAIVFVNGNVTIDGNIQVPEGSFLAIIASGDLSIDDSVANVEGFYLATSFDSGSGTTALLCRGTFIFSTVTLGRDLGNTGNEAGPAEKFEFRPDLFLNAPTILMRGAYSWQEIAP